MTTSIETLPNLKKGTSTYHIALAFLNGRRLSQLAVDKLLEAKGIYRTDMSRKKRHALEWLREHGLTVQYWVGTKGERHYYVTGQFGLVRDVKAKLKNAKKV